MNYCYRFLLVFVFLVSGCVNIPQDVDVLSSDHIRSVLAKENAAENAKTDAKTKVENIWTLFSDSWEGGANGGSIISKSQQMKAEIQMFSLLPDYHRTFDLVVVEPPFASVAWSITATSVTSGYRFTANGMSHFEFDSEGKIIKSWVHTGTWPSTQDLGVDLGIDI
jgi:hypothetical protein